MYTVEFDEIQDLFKCIWTGDKELFWYARAWKALEEAGLTTYRNAYELKKVYVRVYALNIFYFEFCEMEYGQDYNYEIFDYDDTVLSDGAIGQLYAMNHKEEDTVSDDVNYMLTDLAVKELDELFPILDNKFDNLYLDLLSITTTFYNYDAEWDSENTPYEEGENPYEKQDTLQDSQGFTYDCTLFEYEDADAETHWKLCERFMRHEVSFNDLLTSGGFNWLSNFENIYRYQEM